MSLKTKLQISSESLKFNMVVTKRGFTSTGRRDSAGRAVAQILEWIMDVIIMGRARSPVLVTFAGWSRRWSSLSNCALTLSLLQFRMGSPLPERIYREQSASRMGLTLRRGPDPRSFNADLAAMSATMRTMMGLEM